LQKKQSLNINYNFQKKALRKVAKLLKKNY
jgi:hypothetical protein